MPLLLPSRGKNHLQALTNMMRSTHVDLISDALPFGRLWYDTLENAIGYAIHSSRSHDAVIRVYDDAGNVIRTQRHCPYQARLSIFIRSTPKAKMRCFISRRCPP